MSLTKRTELPRTFSEATRKLAKILSEGKYPAPCLTREASELLAEQVLMELARRGINACDAIASIPMEEDIRDR